jgi:hypothetical protein
MKLPKLKLPDNYTPKPKRGFGVVSLVIVASVCFLLGNDYNTQKEQKFNEELRSQYANVEVKKDDNGQVTREYTLKKSKNEVSKEVSKPGPELDDQTTSEEKREKAEGPNYVPPEGRVDANPIKEENKPVIDTPIVNEDQGVPDSTSPTSDIDEGNYLVIGDIKLGQDYKQVFRMYKEYYQYDGPNNQKYFHNGKNGYGDFMLVVGVDNTNRVDRVAYNMFNVTDDTPTVNIGDIQADCFIEDIQNVYGDWDDLSEEDTVKTITYNRFKYNDRTVILSFYIDKPTKLVYGYEIKYQ